MAVRPRAHPPHLRVLVLVHAHLCLVSLALVRAAALSFSYNFSIPVTSAELKYINDSSPSSDRVDLTIRNARNSTGRAFHPQPVRLWDRHTGRTASFNMSFSFAISGNPNITQVPGDGMAFFIAPFPATLPPYSGSALLGLFNDPRRTSSGSPPTVGVEFDTFLNTDWDPQDVTADHMGIDVNSIRSVVYTTDLRKGDLSGTMSANVSYDGSSKMMAVTLQLADGTTHSIQSTVDFRDAGLPQDVAVGFSATTGAAVESNQLLSWSFVSTDPTSNKKMPLWEILLLCALFIGLVVAAVVICRKKRRRRTDQMIEVSVAKEFRYNELSAATSNFSEDRKLGKGSFGEVYRGELQPAPNKGPVAVAVKRLTTERTERTWRWRHYVTEITTLGQLSHKNLVKLVGWCTGGGGGDTLLLVYELVTNGDLHEHLHGSSERLLTWEQRYKIVLGIGSAIEYLHTGKKNPILHRDIKPSNVMLDDELEAKLGDFGLVRQVDPQHGSLGGTGAGDMAYLDPVCISKGSVSIESDMYSFGVLLLEIATGRKPAAVHSTGGLLSNTLVNAVRESYARQGGQVLQMADGRLNGDFDGSQMERVLVVGLLCVQEQRKHRPKIRDAVNLLSNLSRSYPLPEILS